MESENVLCHRNSVKRGRVLKVGMLLLSTVLAASLAGCGGSMMIPAATSATSSATTTAATASTTSAPTVNPTFQKEFIAWAEACQGYALGVYGATTAIANNTIKPSAFPTIKNIIATTGPLCNVFPTNPQQIDTQIIEATAALAESVQANQISASAAKAPTTSTGVVK